MKIITKKMPNDFNIFLFGDTHTGSVMHHKKGWDHLVKTMTNSYAGLPSSRNYGVDHGDVIEGITIDDSRYDSKTTEGNVLKQIDDAVDIRKPIKDQIICILDGNHPRKLWRLSGIKGKCITEIICDRLGVEFGTWTSKIVYKNNKGGLIFKHFCTHGSKSINSTADDPKRRATNMELILKRHLKFKMSDCALMTKGHVHKLICCEPSQDLYIYDDNFELKQGYTSSLYTDNYIHPDHRWYVATGSFYKLYGTEISSYAEIAEYDPLELGFWIVKVRDKLIQNIDKIVL